MQNALSRKVLVVGIILLFVGTSVGSSIGKNIEIDPLKINSLSFGEKGTGNDATFSNPQRGGGAPLDQGLAAYWNFDEGSGNIAADSSGNGNTGTLINNPAWVDGTSGKALSFNGVNNYVQIPQSSSLDVTSQLTVEAWIYPRAYVDNTGQTSGIVCRTDWNGGHIYVLSFYPNSQKASFSVNPAWEQPSTTDVQLNTWTHLAMTYDGSRVQFYMNGQPDGSYALSGPIYTTSNWLAIGCLPTGPYGGAGTYAYFNGIVDEVKIYSKALSQQEIQADMGVTETVRAITEWNIPLACNGEELGQIAADSQGNLWFTVNLKTAGYGSIVKFTPRTASFTTYDLRGGISDQCIGIGIDSKDHVWFALATGIPGTFEWGGVGVLNPENGTISEYRNPLGGTYAGRDYIGLTVDHNDKIWLSGSFSNTIQMFDPTTHNFTIYPIPGNNNWGVYPYMSIASDGSVWFPEILSNRIAKLAPAASNFTEYGIPYQLGSFSNLATVAVRMDANGTIGFNEPDSNKLAFLKPQEAIGTVTHVTPSCAPPTATGAFIASNNTSTSTPTTTFIVPSNVTTTGNNYSGFYGYDIPTPSSESIAVEFDSDSNLWFAERTGGKIGVLLRADSRILEYPIPTDNAHVRAITFDNSGDLWFVEYESMKLGRLSRARDIELSVSPSNATTSIGGTPSYYLTVRNYAGDADRFILSVSGLDSSWYSLSKNNFTALPGEVVIVQLDITVPENPTYVGTYLFNVTLSCSSIRETVWATLVVVLNPILSNLEPANGTILGSTDALFSWRTSSNSSSEIFIKRLIDPTFTLVTGEPGKNHYVQVSNLSRNTAYVWYAHSATLYGEVFSELRTLNVSNGICFSQRTYTFDIERDYAQFASVSVINNDTQPHDLLLEALNPYPDLIVGFVGPGSVDENITLAPGETRSVDFNIFAQDAMQQNYTFTIKLTNLGPEQITDYALVYINVRQPNLNITFTEVSTDPVTLSKTIIATNYGDPITDFCIDTDDNLTGKVYFQPTVYHANFLTGESLTFEAVPVLTVDFTGCQGLILASGAGQTIASLPVNYTLPPGKSIFEVSVPQSLTIEFSRYYDNDESPNTNPLPEFPVETYIVNGSSVFVSQIIVDVYQNGNPAYDANISLTVWNSTGNILSTQYDITDFTGKAMFISFGPAGTYSYQGKLEGYGIKTEKRSFSTDSSSLFSIHPGGINWINISDGNSTYNLSQNVSRVILDQAPFVFKGQKSTIEANTTVTLFINWNADPYKRIQVRGKIEGNTFIFNTSGIPPGNFRAFIFSYSPSYGLAYSDPVNITCTDYSAMYNEGNFSCQLPFPLNSTDILQLNISHFLSQKDTQMDFDFYNIEPTNSNNEYLFTFLIASNETITREFTINVSASGEILYNSTVLLNIQGNKVSNLNFSVPVHYANGSLISEINVILITGNCSLVLVVKPHVRYFYDLRIWVGSDNGIWDWIKSYNPDPYGTIGTALTCGVGSFIDLASLGASGGEKLVWSGIGLTKDVTETLCDPSFKTAAFNLANYGGQTAADMAQVAWGPRPITVENFGSWSKGVGTVFTAISMYNCLRDYAEALSRWWKDAQRILRPPGTVQIVNTSATYCTNHPVVNTTFSLRTPFPMTPWEPNFQHISVACVEMRFTEPWPKDTYRPHQVCVLLNGKVIGVLANVIPEGYYIFKIDPSILNLAFYGTASNTITLATTHLNGGHYVVATHIKLVIAYRNITVTVVASSPEEAVAAVMNMTQSVLANKPDLAVFPEDIKSSNNVLEGINTINITIWNLGAASCYYVPAEIMDGNELIAQYIMYIPPFKNASISTQWNAKAGSHTIYVIVNGNKTIPEFDYSNNQAQTSITVLARDTTPPITTLEIDVPKYVDASGNIYISSTSPFILSAQDNTGGTGVSLTLYQLYNSTYNSGWLTYSTPFYLTGATDGQYYIDYYSTDNEGNVEGTKSTIINLDNTPPTTTLTIAEPKYVSGLTYVTSNTSFSLAAVDAGSGVNEKNYRTWCDGDWTAWTTNTGDFTLSGEGKHYLEYYSADNLENDEDTHNQTYYVDDTPPDTTSSMNGTLGNNGWYTSPVTVAYSAIDTQSGVNNTKYKIDNESWIVYSAPFIISNEGSNTVSYYSVDEVGNAENVKSANLSIDTTSPVTTHAFSGTMGNNSWYISNVTITLTTTDTGSEVNHTFYKIDNNTWTTYTTSFIVTTEGTHSLRYYSVDNAGNSEPVKGPFTMKIDKTKPTTTHILTGTVGNNSWYISNVTVTLTASDAGSGVNHTYYQLDAGSWNTYTAPITITTEGSHTLKYRSVDYAGNTEPVKGPFIIKIDKTKPSTTHSLSGTMGNNSWYISNITVTLTATDTGSGINHTFYQVDNGNWSTYTTSFIVTTAGSHTLKYYSVDNAGNTESVKGPFIFKIDKTKPVTTHAFSGTMGNNNWYISNVTFTLTATDPSPPKKTDSVSTLSTVKGPSGINHTYYKVDNGNWVVYSTPVTVSLDGSHNLSYYSVDNAGNTEPVKGPFLFKIDKTPPNITLVKERISFNQVKFTAQVSDNTSGIDRVEFFLDGVLQSNDTQSPYEWTWTGFGNHQVTATVYDMAGNSKSQSMSTPLAQSQGINTGQMQIVQQQMNIILNKQRLS